MGFATDIKSDLERSAVEVFLDYRGRLYADAVKLCNDFTEAEDLVMRTLDTALRDYDNYETQKGAFYSWLKGILRHNFTRLRLRKVNRGTHPVDPQDIEEMAGSTESTMDEILAHSDHDALRIAINQLDEKYRQAVTLHYFSEFSVKEIAGMLRLPMGTVLRRLQIARQLLAAKLSVTLGRSKKPLAVLAAVLLAAGVAFGITKAVEWVRDWGDGEDAVAMQISQDQLITQDKENTNMNTRKAVVATAALLAAGVSEATCPHSTIVDSDLIAIYDQPGEYVFHADEPTSARLLVVGGGGAGGTTVGGGGAGGEVVASETTLLAGDYVVTVGAGGQPSVGTTPANVSSALWKAGGSGSSSSLVGAGLSLTAGGGGGGGGWNEKAGLSGANGGGGSNGGVGGASSGEGYKGGDASGYVTGGGAGAGGDGQNGGTTAGQGGVGGVGVLSDITGTMLDYGAGGGGGGGGAGINVVAAAAGGASAGAGGAIVVNVALVGESGKVGRGGGGGGGGYAGSSGTAGGVGGSGCVIIRSHGAAGRCLSVRATPEEYGTPNPSYGIVTFDDSEAHELRQTSEVVELSPGKRAVLKGWTLETFDEQTGRMSLVRQFPGSADEDETVARCVYRHQGASYLTWQWEVQYLVTATAAPGGTVSPAEQWVAEGGSATVEATPADDDHSFTGWTGDRSSSERLACFGDVLSPLSVTAQFCSAVSVALNGSDEADGSAAAPFATIAHALEVAGAQARASSSVVNVKVGPGTFLLDQPLVVGDAIRLVGSGRGVTVLDGQAKCHPLEIQHAQAFVSDFTITNGKDNNHGGGVKMTAGTLCRCLVTGNNAGFGGGVYLAAGQLGPLVSCCIVSNNTASFGGGVYSTTVGTLENSLVAANEASLDGGGVYVSRGTLVRHCTIANNSAKTGGGVFILPTSAVDKAHDLIVWGNTAVNSPDINTANCDFALWTNICSSVAVGVSPQTKDPVFKNAANGDYRLAGSSPYRDSAWGAATTETDVFGNPRVQNGRMDVGAIESDPVEKSANMEIESSGHLDEATVTLTAKATNFDIDEAVCYWTFDGRPPTAADHDGEGAVVTHVYTNAGPCSAALAVVYDGETFVDVKEKFLTIAPSVVYVDLNAANPATPYNTRETAAHGLAEALEAADANGGTTIHVAPGTYVFAEKVTVLKPVRIRGEKGPDVTVFDGDGKTPLLNVQAAGVEISGIAIVNGGGGDAAVRMEAGVLANCVIRNNGSGGAYVMNAGLVTGCVITNNVGSNGGGVNVYSSGTLENSLVCGNRATNGGGVYIYHGVLVRHCTIAGNTAANGGGIYYASGWNDKAHDLIVWGNTAVNSPDINTGGCDFSLWTNICSSVAVGVSPQTKDPVFKNAASGDYRLAGSSPYRDAAWGEATTETDVFGNPRVQNGRMDVGAIESDPNERSANMEIVASGHLDTATVTLTARATNFDIDAAQCYWTFDGRLPTAADHDDVGAVVTHDYGLGSCSAALTVVCDREACVDVKTDFLTVAPSRIYFDSHNLRSAYPYNTRETAASNLVEAIGAAAEQGGSTVLVVPGTHVLGAQVSVDKAVRICGERGPAVTVLDGDGKFSLLAVRAESAVVSGITIANGGVDAEAVQVDAGVLTNCVICNSRRSGVYVSGSALVTGCVVSNNASSTYGGGVNMHGGTLENSLVCGNSAANGGGVYVFYGATVRFCTIVGNSATGIGGGVCCAVNDWGDMGHDNIIWGNTAPNSPDINTEGIVYLANWRNICSSVRVGENTSERELVANPYFQNEGKGDYRLRFQSPCRNAAWGTPATAVDLDGAPRVRFRFPDIGCYECQFGSGLMLQVK